VNAPLFPFFSSQNPLNPGKLPEKASASWKSPSNIAIIKYWGKKEGQIPVNPSLSMTLDKAVTQTRVDAFLSGGTEGLLSVNGDNHHSFLPKLNKLFQWLTIEIPLLKKYSFRVETTNTFPHSTGIASSASGMSAFTLCMLTLAEKITGRTIPEEQWMQLASRVSRMGSGSACRSLFGGFTLWGETPFYEGSSDDYAVPINGQVHPLFQNLHDAIVVVSEKNKEISSSLGHSLMQEHPFKDNRIVQTRKHLKEVLDALRTGDFEHLVKVAENEAMALHALIMTSDGNPILIEPATLLILKKIQQARKSGLALFYTLDAGPNVHIIYPGKEKEAAENFILSELVPLCDLVKVIYDRCGKGPVEIRL
jgi:diphosphomevalonate decarboxylase